MDTQYGEFDDIELMDDGELPSRLINQYPAYRDPLYLDPLIDDDAHDMLRWVVAGPAAIIGLIVVLYVGPVVICAASIFLVVLWISLNEYV